LLLAKTGKGASWSILSESPFYRRDQLPGKVSPGFEKLWKLASGRKQPIDYKPPDHRDHSNPHSIPAT
jgi:hypothetical protein